MIISEFNSVRRYAAAILIILSAVLPSSLSAQELTLSDPSGSLTARTVQLFLLVTILGIAPGLAMMITCFPFMVTVLSILRQGLGLQQSPPNMLVISLALFLTWFVMQPVFSAAWAAGIAPFIDGQLSIEEAISRSIEPFRVFMANRVNSETLTALSDLRPQENSFSDPEDAHLSLLIPGFLLSEIERAFQIGFLLLLPFLIIDLVVSAILMSMGMMMVPPAIVALPFKLAFFVVANGWTLIATALVRSYT